MSLSGKAEQEASSSAGEWQGGHLDEPGCQPTGLHSGLRGSGRVEKQTHPGPFFNCGPKHQSKADDWVLSRKRVVCQQPGPKNPCPGGLH